MVYNTLAHLEKDIDFLFGYVFFCCISSLSTMAGNIRVLCRFSK